MSMRLATLAAIALMIWAPPLHAAQLQPTTAAKPAHQLLIIEVSNCYYCQHFRAAVAPVYNKSAHAKTAPLHYVNIQQNDISRLQLRFPVTVAPTAILMRGQKEVARVQGVTAPATFLKLVDHMLKRAKHD